MIRCSSLGDGEARHPLFAAPHSDGVSSSPPFPAAAVVCRFGDGEARHPNFPRTRLPNWLRSRNVVRTPSLFHQT